MKISEIVPNIRVDTEVIVRDFLGSKVIKTKFGSRTIFSYRVSDESGSANLVFWGNNPNLKNGSVIILKNVFSYKNSKSEIELNYNDYSSIIVRSVL